MQIEDMFVNFFNPPLNHVPHDYLLIFWENPTLSIPILKTAPVFSTQG